MASAEAATRAGKCGSIAVVGLATPNAMKPYVEKDCVKSVVLWNPVDLGQAAMHVMRVVADGALKPGATSVKAGKLGEFQVINGSEILPGAPFVFTKENIGGFDFQDGAKRLTRRAGSKERRAVPFRRNSGSALNPG